MTSPRSLLVGLLGPQVCAVGKPHHGVRVSMDILGWQLQDMPQEFNTGVPGGRSTWSVLVSKPHQCTLPRPCTMALLTAPSPHPH